MGEATDEVRSAETLKRSGVDVMASTSAHIDPAIQNQEESGDASQEATEIRSGIEKTRANLSETIDALQDKLDPTRIAEQVKEQIREKATEAYDTAKTAVKEATIGKAGKIVANVTEAFSDMTGRAGTAVSDGSSSVVQYIREHPVPFALLGIGLGMLALNKRQSGGQSSYRPSSNAEPITYGGSSSSDVGTTQSSLGDRTRGLASGVADSARAAADRTTSAVSSATSSVRDAAGSAADATRRQFHDASDQARQGARVATDTFNSTLQDNPMVLGVAAVALGAVVGLSLPSTRIEGEYMGEARDKFVGQAKSVAQDAAQKVQRVTEQAGRTIKDAAQKEGLVPPQSGEQHQS